MTADHSQRPFYLNAWHILTPKERRRAIRLVALLLIAMVLETLGIGLVIPVLAVMTQQDLGSSYPFLVPALDYLGNPSQEQLVIWAMLALVVVFTVKTGYLALIAWWQARFVHTLQVDLGQRVFRAYLRSPYVFHLQRNSSELIATVATEANFFAATGTKAAIRIIAEMQVLLGISVLLLIVEPVGSIGVAIVMGVAVWVFSRLTRNRVTRWGHEHKRNNRLRYKDLQEALGGIKDVKVLGRESDFLSQFRQHSEAMARASIRQTTVGQLPRLWLELLAVLGLATLVLIMVWRGSPLGTLVPTLGLFAAAAFKMMPALNRVLSGVQDIRFAAPLASSLVKELDQIETDHPPRGNPLPFERELTVQEVSYHYPDADVPALRGISLSIPRGASVGFIGTSGAGKSTLVDIILGLLAPEEGAVLVDGVDIRTNTGGWRDQIGYVPQSIYLSDDSLRRNVAFGLPANEIDDVAVRRALKAAQLLDFVDGLLAGTETIVGERGVRLSGGQLQRIGIARALYHDPPVVILDEATSSLDTATESGVMEAVNQLRSQKTLLIISHRSSTVEECDRVIRLEHGQVVESGRPSLVLKEAGAGTKAVGERNR